MLFCKQHIARLVVGVTGCWLGGGVEPACAQPVPAATPRLETEDASVQQRPKATDDSNRQAFREGEVSEESFAQSIRLFIQDLVPPSSTFEFLERNYVAYRAWPSTQIPRERGGTPQLFEADLSPHFFLYNSLEQMTRGKLHGAAPRQGADWSAALSFTMRVRLRMLNLESAPVRTPSFMPRLNWQTYYLDNRPRKSGDPFALYGTRLSVGHHSNGQEGCPFEVGRLEEETCQPVEGAPDPRTVNRDNASFSYNHLTLALHRRWGFVREAAISTAELSQHDQASHTIGLVGMVYPVGFLWAGTNSAQRASLYGTWNLRAEYAMETMVPPWLTMPGGGPGQLRWEVQYSQFFGSERATRQLWQKRTARQVPGYLLTTTLTYSSIKGGGIGLFLRADRGRDYYNMLFVDTISQVLLGLAIDTSGKLDFGETTPGREIFAESTLQ